MMLAGSCHYLCVVCVCLGHLVLVCRMLAYHYVTYLTSKYNMVLINSTVVTTLLKAMPLPYFTSKTRDVTSLSLPFKTTIYALSL